MALEPDTSGVHQFEDGSFSDYSEPFYGFKMDRSSISCFWSKEVGTIALNTSAYQTFFPIRFICCFSYKEVQSSIYYIPLSSLLHKVSFGLVWTER